MMKISVGFVALFLAWFSVSAAQDTYPVADAVEAVIEAADNRMDYARAKAMIDRLVDPSVSMDETLAEIDQMVAVVEKMIATLPEAGQGKSLERLKALKAFVYRAGHWNDNRPFEYDLSDPYGQGFANRLLSTYLKTRKGNCISMPILFLALGERLGLDVSLSTAPLHVLVKYTDKETGRTYNLEPTSGAGFTRDLWYRKKSAMTQAAIDNGVFLKHLSRKESIAVMGGIVVEHLISSERFEEAIAVADILLMAYPQFGYILAKKGTAYYHLLRREFISKYPSEQDIPPGELARAEFLSNQNTRAFQRAEALGWRQAELR